MTETSCRTLLPDERRDVLEAAERNSNSKAGLIACKLLLRRRVERIAMARSPAVLDQ